MLACINSDSKIDVDKLSYHNFYTMVERVKSHLLVEEFNYIKSLVFLLRNIAYEMSLIHKIILDDDKFYTLVKGKIILIKKKIYDDITIIKNRGSVDFSEIKCLICDFEKMNSCHENNNYLIYIHKMVYDLNNIVSSMEQLSSLFANKLSNNQEEKNAIHKVSSTNAMKFAARTVVALLVTGIALKLLNIPGLYQVWIACLVVIVTPNIGELLYKALMRLSGIISGGILGLLIGGVSFNLHSMTLLFVLFFIVIFFIIRLGLKFRQYEYAAIQCCVILTMILFTGGYGNVSFELGYERFIGIFSGVIIASIVSFLFNPSLPSIIVKKLLLVFLIK